MSAPSSSQRPPRAFCQATGFVYQSVGFLLTLGTCCWWSFEGRVGTEAQSTEAGRAMVEVLRDASAAQIWGMCAVCISFVGGLAVVALGISLQHDMSRSGRGAKWLTGVIAAFFFAYLVMSVVSFPGPARTVTAACMAVIWTILFLLGGASADELRRNPPATRDSSWTRRDEDDLRRAPSPRPRDGTNP